VAGIRRTDSDPGWIMRRFRKLEAEIRELRSAKRVITDLTISGTGGVTTGDIIVMGTQAQGDRGMRFFREDGTLAFRLAKPFAPSDPQSWSLHDRYGAQVVGESSIGAGLYRPHLEHPFQPVAATSGTAVTCGPYGWERTTSSSSWTTLFAYDGKAQNLLVDFKFAAVCSDATTAGEIQVIDLDTGTARPGYLISPWVGSIPAGTTTMTVVDPSPDKVVSTIGNAGPIYMRLGVQVRVTAGTGSITLSIPQAIGG
jgi:hypothetical protein